ncbi:MAG: DNA polymerase III subunit chi, partial [Chromatocurvus sp.]
MPDGPLVTRVGFYVVQAQAPGKRLQVAARLADKAFQRGHAIFFNCASQAQADDMDEEKYSLILANPPFAGSLDYES